MLRPAGQCRGFLGFKECAIVSPGNSGLARNMIQNRFDNPRRDADFIHASAAKSAQIVDSPARDLHRFIEIGLCPTPASEAALLASAENKLTTVLWLCLEDGAHHVGHWHD